VRARRLILLALVVGAGFLAAAVAVPHNPADLRALADSGGAAAPLAALVGWIALTCALFPGTVLAAACGLAFGPVWGGLLSCLGATLGGMAAFAIARGGGRAAAERLLGDRLPALRALMERRGFATVLAARMAPGVPATGLHYAAGLSRVHPGAFAAAIALGGAPRTVAYAVLGAGIGTGSPATLALGAGAIALLGSAGLVIAWRLRPRPAAAA
jgi:uncharacterized membrane protein YdjX (TVP38/TMEM64 family)